MPIEVVVQDLDRGRLQTPGGLLRDRDDDGRVRFPDDETLLALPFEFVSIDGMRRSRSLG